MCVCVCIYIYIYIYIYTYTHTRIIYKYTHIYGELINRDICYKLYQINPGSNIPQRTDGERELGTLCYQHC